MVVAIINEFIKTNKRQKKSSSLPQQKLFITKIKNRFLLKHNSSSFYEE